MSIEKYLFWSMIQGVVNKLDNLDKYKEDNWVKNIYFKENLNSDIQIIDNLIKNTTKLKIKLRAR